MRKLLFILLTISACKGPVVLQTPAAQTGYTGSQFFTEAAKLSLDEREELAVGKILAGNIPSFLKRLVKINTSIIVDGKQVNAYYFVTPDYLSIGTNNDFARVPLTPYSAQKIADSLYCFIPTKKIVDDIYKQAVVKLQPVPLFAFRDSAPTFYHHHLIIEGQRKLKTGLIAGIKKDVVISDKLLRDAKGDRVAIYGWHKPDGKSIQPLYTGHVNWYVDYSHGVRLVYRTIWVDGKAMDYVDVMKNEKLKRLLCDEEFCSVYRYRS